MAGTLTHNIPLNNSEINLLLDELQEWLVEQKIEHRSTLSLILSIEELLLRWQDHFGEEQFVSISLGNRFRRPCISLSLEGEPFNPAEQSEAPFDWNTRVLAGLGLVPEYAYRHRVNRLSFRLKPQKQSSLRNLLIAIAAALALGFLGQALLPAHTGLIVDSVVNPVRNTLLSLISAVAVPMVFLSVLLGICSSGSASEFGKIGNSMLLGFIGKIFLFTFVIGLITFPLYQLNFSQTALSIDQVSGTLNMILDIFPKNLTEPFFTGNTLQVIVIAVAMGLALLVLGDRANEIKTLAEKANALIALLLEWVCRLIPAIVFLILLETIWGNGISILSQLWKPLLLTLASAILIPVLLLVITVKKNDIGIIKTLQKMMPPLMIAFTTSSSAATYNENMDCVQKKLGVDQKIAGFGLPAGSVIYKPIVPIYFLMCIFFSAEQYGISCSPAWLLLAWLTAALLGIAAPPIPGGAMACYAVMFSQMGLPTEAIVFAVTMDIVIDRFLTTSHTMMLQLDLVNFASRHKLLKHDVLRK